MAAQSGSLVVVPLYSGREIQGTLSLSLRQPRELAPGEYVFLTGVSAALALNLALSREIATLEHRERRNQEAPPVSSSLPAVPQACGRR